MSTQKILLLGATGETGGDILNGLLEDGSFSAQLSILTAGQDITCLIRPESGNKPAAQKLASRGIKVVEGDISGSVETLTQLLTGYDIFISAISATGQLDQIKLVDAAAKAGIKRFVPCGFTTVCPPDGVMKLRDDKEKIYQRIWFQHLPYTIIDVGYWYQISWPRLPSGRLDYALLIPNTTKYGDGDAPNLLTDKRDMGHFVAQIIKDERTLNQKVFTYSDVLSQNEIFAIMEEKSGEKVEFDQMSSEQCIKQVGEAKAGYEADPSDFMKASKVFQTQYIVSKYIRRDNTLENAKYLGYLDARALYPDFKPIPFSAFVDELLDGKGTRPYASRFSKPNKNL